MIRQLLSTDRTLASPEDTIVQALDLTINPQDAWLMIANALGPKRKRLLVLPSWARRGAEGYFYMVENTVLPSVTTKRGFLKRK